MTNWKTKLRLITMIAPALAILIPAGVGQAVQLQDIARIKGAESNKIIGMGLVVGLNGTGDGGKFMPAMRPLANIIAHFIDESVLATELKDAKNVALVSISADLPAEGVREGDRVDLKVAAIAAKSLHGGRLLTMPLTGPLPNSPVYAYGEGPVSIEDEDHPTAGIIPGGAIMVRDVFSQCMDQYGRVHFILNDANASWPVSNNLVSRINGMMVPDGPDIAMALDAKNILVDVPIYERNNPAGFISQILQIYIDPNFVTSGAKVVINERTGTIVVSGDVQISPVIISHKGLTITTVTPMPETNEMNPRIEQVNFVAVDPLNRGGPKLADLLNAFNQLKVEAQDRIEIIKLIDKSGKLHARLELE